VDEIYEGEEKEYPFDWIEEIDEIMQLKSVVAINPRSEKKTCIAK
jgi:hypothetical protein